MSTSVRTTIPSISKIVLRKNVKSVFYVIIRTDFEFLGNFFIKMYVFTSFLWFVVHNVLLKTTHMLQKVCW